MSKNNPLIVALDVSSPIRALYLVGNLRVTGVAFKIGYELFAVGGPRIVKKIVNQHVRVFLDLKFHDIPNTVSRAADVVTRMGVWMFNVHASGGVEMMKRAKQSSLEAAEREKISSPLVVGVTVLTSQPETKKGGKIAGEVQRLAGLSRESGLDGVVASGREAKNLRKSFGPNFCIVTPGIRNPQDRAGDQKRTMTPAEAIQAGSDYLVVGRPILEAKRPIKAIESILNSIQP